VPLIHTNLTVGNIYLSPGNILFANHQHHLIHKNSYVVLNTTRDTHG
jgi:hypothetical protein